MPVTATAPLFVLGFYRGGTTFLQRMLNCFEDLAIWGEHSGFLRDFARAYGSIRTSAVQKVNVADYANFSIYAGRFVSWANGFDADGFLAWQRSSIARLFDCPPGLRWGFKEIRYNDTEMMQYLTALYPDCRILFLTRNPADILISRMLVRWESRFKDPAEIEGYCREFEAEWQVALAAAREMQCTSSNLAFVSYESLVEDQHIPSDLLDFLQVDSRTLNQSLYRRTLQSRAGSSFGDVRNRRLTGREVALRVSSVRDFVASSVVLGSLTGETTPARGHTDQRTSSRMGANPVLGRSRL